VDATLLTTHIQYLYLGVEIADFTLPTSLDDMFKFYQLQFGEQTLEDEIVTNSFKQEMEENELEDLNEFVTVVDRDDNVEILTNKRSNM
jgi:hypothetical protein